MSPGGIPETGNQRAWRPAALSHRSGDWSPERVRLPKIHRELGAVPARGPRSPAQHRALSRPRAEATKGRGRSGRGPGGV